MPDFPGPAQRKVGGMYSTRGGRMNMWPVISSSVQWEPVPLGEAYPSRMCRMYSGLSTGLVPQDPAIQFPCEGVREGLLRLF